MIVEAGAKSQADSYFLGLDIGANSIGWALIALDHGEPSRLLRSGVRVFEAGVEGTIESGRDQSRAVKRREARLRRRMLWRRRHRRDSLAGALQQAGLLPPGDLSSAEGLTKLFRELDHSLFPDEARKRDPDTLVYHLRARALDEPLTPHELGRALYHLGQRRGFLSNRRAPKKKGDEDEGKVKQAISELAQSIETDGACTLGEYFSGLDPHDRRIRQRWTGRSMFKHEFEAIWAAQAQHHPDVLTANLKKRVHHAIFFQRPLKAQKNLIGHCELEKACPRAPLALLAAQRFRLLQKVNDLLVTTPDGETRLLTSEERKRLIEALETQGDRTFGQIRKLLGLKNHQFNLEEDDGEKKLIGSRTASALAKVFGDRWAGLSPEERDRVVEDVRSIQNAEALKRRGIGAWALDDDAARRFAEISPEDGYCSLSRRALAKILPVMEQGVQYATARKEIYGEQRPPGAVETLPALAKVVTVRNPAVQRALTEVRKVVNAIVREHGKPPAIRIELARDLKKSREDRKDIWKRNEQNRKAREQAAERILKEAGVPQPRRSDIEKALLWDECGGQCPYTGRPINFTDLFGEHPQFDVEHIIPLSRCLDGSFFNKTLCEIAENRDRKRERTPWEAYGSDQPKWDEILQRVAKFHGTAAKAKLERFKLESLEDLDGFTTRQLNDTAYASRLAVEFLGTLYGAGATGVDPQGRRRVQAGRGQVTAFLRGEWGMNAVLGGGEKTRDDHRQHAVDAVAIALTDAKTTKMLSDAAARARQERRRRFGRVEAPWPSFLDDVRRAVDHLIVSHRVSRKTNAALHEETVYSKPHDHPDGGECVHVRKRVESLSPGDIASIVDPIVRAAVEAKLQEIGGSPDKAFATSDRHPTLKAKDGREIPIHTVRIRRRLATEAIGKGASERRVTLASNHHIEIVEATDRKGQPQWEGFVVSTYEAMRRLRAKEPVVRRDHGEGKKFLFSLAGGEVMELDEDNEKRGLYVVRTVNTSGRLDFVTLNEARKKEDIKKAGAWMTASLEPLRKRNCRKVVVAPLGEVRRAND